MIVNIDGDIKGSISFLQGRQLELPGYVPSGIIPEKLFKGNLPTTLILNKAGKMVYHHEGAADYSSPKIKHLLRNLLKE